ncbi:MAG: RecX family transcriptional regulator [Chloroflexota bacterium]|nr:RecX family transcriptional regulator [Chloroflexota bacterium]
MKRTAVACKISPGFFFLEIMPKKITALKAQKNNVHRVSVFLDGEFAFGIYRRVAERLKVGQELNEEQIRALDETEAIEKAYHRAVNLLSYRVRSEAEVRRNLNKHNTPDYIIEEVLDRLRRNHLVNDRDFAETWIENRSAFRPRGRRALRSELRRKGVDYKIIADALQNLDEEELAYRAACKKFRRYRKLEWPEFRKKMLGCLARRGFYYAVSALAVKQVWEENQPKPPSRNKS